MYHVISASLGSAFGVFLMLGLFAAQEVHEPTPTATTQFRGTIESVNESSILIQNSDTQNARTHFALSDKTQWLKYTFRSQDAIALSQTAQNVGHAAVVPGQNVHILSSIKNSGALEAHKITILEN